MKKKIQILTVLFVILASTSLWAQSGTAVRVSGASTSGMGFYNANGTYSYNGDVNDRPAYHRSDRNGREWVVEWSTAGYWLITTPGFSSPYIYQNLKNTPNPPQTEWTSYSTNADPPPTLSGSGTFAGTIVLSIVGGDGSMWGNNSTHDFGIIDAGSSSSITFRLTNVGSTALTITLPVQKQGTNASEWSLDSSPSTPIASNTHSDFMVTFNPTAPGQKSANLAITNSDNDVNPFIINMTGGSGTPGSIGHYVFNDENGNGIQDATEPGIANVALELFDNSSGERVKAADATTDGAGYYSFYPLYGTLYTVEVNTSTIPDFDYTTSTTGGNTHDVQLAEGQEYEQANFGYQYSFGSIGQYVFDDTDKNGIMESGETGIPQVSIDLYKNTGREYEFVVRTTTDRDGSYTFDELYEGTYSVRVDHNTLPNPEVTFSTTGGDEQTVGLGIQEQYTDANFGYETTISSIGHYVFNDKNANGIQEEEDPGIENVSVNLFKKTESDCVKVDEAVTNQDGYYEFTPLGPATYYVNIVHNTLPNPVFNFSTTGGDSQKVILAKEEQYTEANFGYETAISSIGHYVFDDKNANGIQDEEDPGIENVSLSLYKIVEADCVKVDETVSNQDGFYEFVPAFDGLLIIRIVGGRAC